MNLFDLFIGVTIAPLAVAGVLAHG